jgi:molybdopterin converting factor small subunit
MVVAEPLITVSVLLFGPLRERVGEGMLAMEVAAGTTTTVLLDRLAEAFAPIGPYREHVRLAVNGQYVKGEIALRDGDEVALITPTSGG